MAEQAYSVDMWGLSREQAEVLLAISQQWDSYFTMRPEKNVEHEDRLAKPGVGFKTPSAAERHFRAGPD